MWPIGPWLPSLTSADHYPSGAVSGTGCQYLTRVPTWNWLSGLRDEQASSRDLSEMCAVRETGDWTLFTGVQVGTALPESRWTWILNVLETCIPFAGTAPVYRRILSGWPEKCAVAFVWLLTAAIFLIKKKTINALRSMKANWLYHFIINSPDGHYWAIQTMILKNIKWCYRMLLT